ncbi:uncharacterized protein LOC133419582 [Cololabis saira]|uniref:uncharacterized protein LOC133419582 n=1 Tax=Cololabis saira TaxID=129043 RepID=UPI002AD4739A|nr:uncharacterized protein LOC133419582 [Cololabis saira]XP_061564800.1 uncharacterized protein LOC133419582 [Cololabis saira]
MARSGRPASESYQPARRSVRQSVSSCHEAGMVGEEDDRAPIFSLSKSSMDVVTATDKRDPAWTRLDLRRSSSTNTHSDQSPATLQQLRHHRWRHNSHHASFTTQNEDLLSPPPLSERWMANMHRWSGCSGSTQGGSTLSRSSTPDTVVWKGGAACLYGLHQDSFDSFMPDSPLSKLASPPTTPSPFISPCDTPTLQSLHLLNSSSSPLTLSADKLPESSAPTLEEDGSPEKLSFQFPSPVPSPISLPEPAAYSEPDCFLDNTMKRVPSLRENHLSEDEEAKSPLETSSCLKPDSPAEGQESPRCHLVLPEQAGEGAPTGRGGRPPLVSSLSDSRLGGCRRCDLNPWQAAKTPKVEEATMTSRREMVDAAVQTASPLGSSGDLRGNICTSNTGSHSILGSPPGSRLNLKSPLGSHSNLVSPSSSMFPVSSGDEEEEKQGHDPEWDASSASSPQLERKRSCLKSEADERDEMGRRSSMKQVQWDEDGLTWEIHGASLDPQELSSAIQKHLDLKNTPPPRKRSSKKKKAPKPPSISSLVTTMAPDMSPPAMGIKCMVEGDSEDTPEAETPPRQDAGDRTEETTVIPRRGSKTERDNKNDPEEKVCGEHVVENPKASTDGTEPSRKRAVIRSLRRPLWCGGSRNTDD